MTRRVFVRENKMATFVCQECGNSRSVDASIYMKHDKAVKVKFTCPCGESSTVLLERRQLFRKSVNFSGHFYWLDSKGVKREGGMIVEDLSRDGLRIKFLVKQDIQIGWKLFVEFYLDDSRATLVRKQTIIRSIDEFHAGLEFTDFNPTDIVDHALNRYCWNP